MLFKIKSYILSKLVVLYGTFSKMHQEQQYASFRSKYNLSAEFRFNGPGIILYGDGEIIIDKDTYVGSYSYLGTDKGQFIKIGEGCAISHNVKFYTNSYLSDCDFSEKPRLMKFGNILIGNNVWIGANVFIGCGVEIGDNCVIGANSVVTKDLEKNGIYAGIPAKLIRYKRS